MTVGKPEFNLDSFGIRYVRKAERSTGSTPSTEKTPHGLDKPKDSLDLAGNNPLNSQQIDTTTSYGEGSTGTQGDSKNTGENAKMTGIGGTRKNPNATAQGNQVNFKKPEGEALPKNAAMQLAIIKCKLLKMKASWTGSGSPYPKPAEPEIKEKGTGDKIPHEKLGDLPQGKDDKEVESATIENEKGEEKKLPSPADRYKSEIRKMAIDAIDEAMKNIGNYQDAKEKALQDELIKEALEKGEGLNASDGVNAVYSDVKQRKVE